MASTSGNNTKKMNKLEESSSVQKLLASLQEAQNKSTTGAGTSGTNEKQKKSNNEKRKNKASVGARMQQQAENARQQTKRPRHVSTSKSTKTTTSDGGHQSYRGPRVPIDVLDELEFRFVSNMVEKELVDNMRVCFHLELAHWYYVDHMVEGNYKGCPNLGIRDFTVQMYQHCKHLKKHAQHADEVLAAFREYKATVPTYGAILIDEELEHVIMVQSYFAKGNSWGFPKGKINEAEPPRDAAIRETLEETGFDFGLYSEKEKKFQKFIGDSMIRLYAVKNVPKDFNFQPQTRKEIRKIQWFKIDDLPTDKNDRVPAYLNGYKFFMAFPFIQDIQDYARKEREKRRKQLADGASTSSQAVGQGPSILSQLFPQPAPPPPPAPSQPQTPQQVYKRMTSEELFSSFRKPAKPESDDLSRPTLPDMSPSVDGLDSLAVLGLCTPLKPGASLNQFSAAPTDCPVISEEEIGFAMPTDLQQPVVTTEHPWQHKVSETSSSPPPTIESHQGWLDTQLVNAIMHSPNATCTSPATPTAVLGHLIGKPIQPQAILPQAATPTALGSAEKPKSSRISLSDNSAFKAISSPSAPKATQPPASNVVVPVEKTRSASLSGTGDSRKVARSLFPSVTSPLSSELHSEEMWEQLAATGTAGTSISSLAASNQELAMFNRDTPVEQRSALKHVLETAAAIEKTEGVEGCQQWNKRIQLDKEYIAGPVSFWIQQFSITTASQ